MKCNVCGKEYLDELPTCPNCTKSNSLEVMIDDVFVTQNKYMIKVYEIQKKFLKKISVIILYSDESAKEISPDTDINIFAEAQSNMDIEKKYFEVMDQEKKSTKNNNENIYPRIIKGIENFYLKYLNIDIKAYNLFDEITKPIEIKTTQDNFEKKTKLKEAIDKAFETLKTICKFQGLLGIKNVDVDKYEFINEEKNYFIDGLISALVKSSKMDYSNLIDDTYEKHIGLLLEAIYIYNDDSDKKKEKNKMSEEMIAKMNKLDSLIEIELDEMKMNYNTKFIQVYKNLVMNIDLDKYITDMFKTK